MVLTQSLLALAACLFCIHGPASAVVPGAVSSTAVFVCDYRAIGALHPDPKLRNKDRLAAKLCPAALLPRDYALARYSIDRDPEGLSGYFFVNARTLHIDAQLEKAVEVLKSELSAKKTSPPSGQ